MSKKRHCYKHLILGAIIGIFITILVFHYNAQNETHEKNGSQIIVELFEQLLTPIPDGVTSIIDGDIFRHGKITMDSLVIHYDYFQTNLLKVIELSNDTMLITITNKGGFSTNCDSTRSIQIIKSFFESIRAKQKADALTKMILNR